MKGSFSGLFIGIKFPAPQIERGGPLSLSNQRRERTGGGFRDPPCEESPRLPRFDDKA